MGLHSTQDWKLQHDATQHEFEHQRADMVSWQLRDRGINDPALLTAMLRVPRHKFLPTRYPHLSYADAPLPIGHGQAMPSPYLTAHILASAEIQPGDRVLEVGTGSGYATAILSEMASTVYSVEIIPELAERARQQLGQLGYRNVHIKFGDGYWGLSQHAPYDRIIIWTAAPYVAQSWIDQLAISGKLVVPIGIQDSQIRVITKQPNGLQESSTVTAKFTPMSVIPIGKAN